MKKHILPIFVVMLMLLSSGCEAKPDEPHSNREVSSYLVSDISSSESKETKTTVNNEVKKKKTNTESRIKSTSEPNKSTKTAIAENEDSKPNETVKQKTEVEKPKINKTEENNASNTPKKQTKTKIKDKQKSSKKSKPTVSKKSETKKKEKSKKSEEAKKTKKSQKSKTVEKTKKAKKKSAYDYKFDIETIRQDLIDLGCSVGLTHITTDDGVKVTPKTASWGNPIVASKSFQGELLKKQLKDYVQSMPGLIEDYGGNKIEYFTIYIEPLSGGSYKIYFLY